jgi:hypothetical protein
MVAKITTSEDLAQKRALKKLGDVLASRGMKAAWGVEYSRLAAVLLNEAKVEKEGGLAIVHQQGGALSMMLWQWFISGQFFEDFTEYNRLLRHFSMFLYVRKPEKFPSDYRRLLPEEIRGPHPGEIEEMIKQAKRLFFYITKPPPKPPTDGGSRVRKVA